jgi:putative salt-induced outer membrane protein YdiY
MTTIARRKGRWTPLGVAATVLGFVVWWPLGLAVIAYIMWGGSIDDLASDTVSQIKQSFKSRSPAGYGSSSGNAAFDAYKAETLRRLEEEQEEFNEFVTRLREARDREEFERFMSERSASLKKDSEAPSGA